MAAQIFDVELGHLQHYVCYCMTEDSLLHAGKPGCMCNSGSLDTS